MFCAFVGPGIQIRYTFACEGVNSNVNIMWSTISGFRTEPNRFWFQKHKHSIHRSTSCTHWECNKSGNIVFNVIWLIVLDGRWVSLYLVARDWIIDANYRVCRYSSAEKYNWNRLHKEFIHATTTSAHNTSFKEQTLTHIVHDHLKHNKASNTKPHNTSRDVANWYQRKCETDSL